MSPATVVRLRSGLASAAAGLFLLIGHILKFGGDPEYGTVPDETRRVPLCGR
jgi:hypothetical protein